MNRTLDGWNQAAVLCLGFGVSPFDLLTFVAVAMFLTAVVFVASYLPTRTGSDLARRESHAEVAEGAEICLH